MKKSVYLPILLFLVGVSFYVYYGVYHEAWMDNLVKIIAYAAILILLHFVLKKKEKYEDERKNKHF